MSLTPPSLELALNLKVLVDKPIEAGLISGLQSRGRRRIIPILGGSVDGPTTNNISLHGRIVPGGADFQIVVSDTLADLDARYIIELEGGERIFVTNRAIRRASAEVTSKLVRGEVVDPALVYFRCAPSFEVNSPSLLWLTESLFVGTGTRHPDRVDMSFFRVT